MVNEPQRLEKKSRPRKCPNCGFSPVGKILYGYPMFSPELEAEIKEGKTVIGGCDMSPLNADWECSNCKLQIWKIGWQSRWE